MRTFIAALSLYIVTMAAIDALMFKGRYRDAVWREANHQTQRAHAEVRNLLHKLGI